MVLYGTDTKEIAESYFSLRKKTIHESACFVLAGSILVKLSDYCLKAHKFGMSRSYSYTQKR